MSKMSNFILEKFEQKMNKIQEIRFCENVGSTMPFNF